MSSKLTLGYWNIRGLAQPIRLLMEYAGLLWEDKFYVQAGADAPVPFDKSEWFDVKPTLGLRFPNLPYLIDGDLKITQSQAILRYVAKKKPELQLLGTDASSAALCDEVIFECMDAKSRMTGLMYRVGRDSSFIENELPTVLKSFEDSLISDLWFAGDALTCADFIVWEYLDCAVLYTGQVDYLSVNNYPKLASFKTRFEAIPSIRAYLDSERFTIISGINNQHAKFR